MAVREIVKYPDPVLREETFEVKEITEDIRQLVRDLTDTMYAQNGAGIAAISGGNAWTGAAIGGVAGAIAGNIHGSR